MRRLSKPMRIPQTMFRSFVLASAVMCVPISSCGSEVAAALNSAPSLADNAPETGQTPGVAKLLGDTSPLAAVPPSGNSAPQSQPVVNLSWKPSTSAGVTYNVYRSMKKGECLKTKSNYCQKISPSLVTSTNYTDSTVQTGHRYFYVVKSVRSGGPESGPSNETEVVISPRKK